MSFPGLSVGKTESQARVAAQTSDVQRHEITQCYAVGSTPGAESPRPAGAPGQRRPRVVCGGLPRKADGLPLALQLSLRDPFIAACDGRTTRGECPVRSADFINGNLKTD